MMKAMILAAGLGTRLGPVTETMPKALVPVAGKPMIMNLLERLSSWGIKEFVINVHHFADELEFFLRNLNFSGITISISDERDLLLDTGGAIKRAAEYFADGKPFLVNNVDVLTATSPFKLLSFHVESCAMATLAVRDRVTSRYLLFNQDHILAGRENRSTGMKEMVGTNHDNLKSLAFSGVQIMSPGIFRYFPAGPCFSIIDLYLAAATAGEKVVAYRHDEDQWIDLGIPERIAGFNMGLM
jgi:NDP-sugar pyrophosphorylase family protein